MPRPRHSVRSIRSHSLNKKSVPSLKDFPRPQILGVSWQIAVLSQKLNTCISNNIGKVTDIGNPYK